MLAINYYIMNIGQLIDDFNETLSDFIDNLAAVCPDNIISDNRNLIKRMLAKSDTKNKVIDTFVAKVLIYKPQIDRGDESFFLSKSYDDDIADVSDGKNLTGKIFEFKSIWKKLSLENKNYVIQYMQLLCELAQNYFLLLDSGQGTGRARKDIGREYD